MREGIQEAERLEIIRDALLARAEALDVVKRMPRGYDLGRLRRESAVLRAEAEQIGRARALEIARQRPALDLTNGVA